MPEIVWGPEEGESLRVGSRGPSPEGPSDSDRHSIGRFSSLSHAAFCLDL